MEAIPFGTPDPSALARPPVRSGIPVKVRVSHPPLEVLLLVAVWLWCDSTGLLRSNVSIAQVCSHLWPCPSAPPPALPLIVPPTLAQIESSHTSRSPQHPHTSASCALFGAPLHPHRTPATPADLLPPAATDDGAPLPVHRGLPVRPRRGPRARPRVRPHQFLELDRPGLRHPVGAQRHGPVGVRRRPHAVAVQQPLRHRARAGRRLPAGGWLRQRHLRVVRMRVPPFSAAVAPYPLPPIPHMCQRHLHILPVHLHPPPLLSPISSSLSTVTWQHSAEPCTCRRACCDGTFSISSPSPAGCEPTSGLSACGECIHTVKAGTGQAPGGVTLQPCVQEDLPPSAQNADRVEVLEGSGVRLEPCWKTQQGRAIEWCASAGRPDALRAQTRPCGPWHQCPRSPRTRSVEPTRAPSCVAVPCPLTLVLRVWKLLLLFRRVFEATAPCRRMLVAVCVAVCVTVCVAVCVAVCMCVCTGGDTVHLLSCLVVHTGRTMYRTSGCVTEFTHSAPAAAAAASPCSCQRTRRWTSRRRSSSSC